MARFWAHCTDPARQDLRRGGEKSSTAICGLNRRCQARYSVWTQGTAYWGGGVHEEGLERVGLSSRDIPQPLARAPLANAATLGSRNSYPMFMSTVALTLCNNDRGTVAEPGCTLHVQLPLSLAGCDARRHILHLGQRQSQTPATFSMFCALSRAPTLGATLTAPACSF